MIHGNVILKGGHVPCTPFGCGIQGNAHQLMIYKGIVETVGYRSRELFQIFLVQRQRRHDLFI